MDNPKKSGFRGIYGSMKNRCNNPNSKDYKYYGGRGIRVCDKWQTIKGFEEDMYSAYAVGLTIERVNVNGDYCQENCIWIPRSEQWKNRRNSFIAYNGRSLRRSEWFEDLGVTANVFSHRQRKWNASFVKTIHLLKNPDEIPEKPEKEPCNRRCRNAKTYVEPVVIDGRNRFYIRDSVTNEIRNII